IARRAVFMMGPGAREKGEECEPRCRPRRRQRTIPRRGRPANIATARPAASAAAALSPRRTGPKPRPPCTTPPPSLPSPPPDIVMGWHRIVLGIGNPGPEYDGTRHNAGFMVLDLLAQRRGLAFERLERRADDGSHAFSGKVKARVCEGRRKGRSFLL